MNQYIAFLAAFAIASIEAKGLDTYLSKDLFQKLFPNALPIYQYENMIAMSKKYPAFANTGNDDVDKREVAAFLGQISLESGDLQYVEEINKSDYCQPSPSYPCAKDKQYFGRGPIQLSWNYNYKDFGDAFGKDLVNSPELVAQDKDLVWLSAFWFWNSDKYNGNIHDVVGQPGGFAYTTYLINGGLECGPNPPNKESEKTRISSFKKFCGVLGVDAGSDLSCQTSAYPPKTPWPKTSSPSPTVSPTNAPTQKPTHQPTNSPSDQPTNAPTSAPTSAPTAKPTSKPTKAPTTKPTKAPSPTPAGSTKKLWEQCGGKDYTGGTNCESGSICYYQDEWYSQCIPSKQRNL